MAPESDSTPTTVLQVLPALELGGVERGTVEIAQAITRHGGRAIVASGGGALVARITQAGGRHHALPLASKNPLTIWANAGRLVRLIRAERVDLVHARSRAPAWSAWLACRRTGTPFVTTWHGSYAEDLPGKRRYNAVMALGARVIAISQHIAAEIARRHPEAAGRIRVIPRGVDAAVFDPHAVAADRIIRLAGQWRVPDGHRIILLPARLTRWKGAALLIAALPSLPADTCVVLVGPDQGRARFVGMLLRQAARLAVAARVWLVGECRDMPAAFMLADVVVNPSIAPEGFGRTVIEAQAMARVVLAAEHGGACETIVDGQTGLLFAPGSVPALAAALNAALALPVGQRQAMGQAARAAVLDRFTTAAMQNATLAVYDELLADG